MLALRRGLLVMTLVSAAWANAGQAQEGVPLSFRFAAGQKAQYEISFSGSGSLISPEEGVVPVGLKGTLLLSCAVSEVLPDGSGRLQVRIPEGEMEISVGEQRAALSYRDQKLRWYANGREYMPPEADLGQLPLLGTPLVLRMAPDGQVTEVGFGDHPLVRSLQSALPQLNLTGVGSFGRRVFPDRPIRVGETWHFSEQLSPFGPAIPITVSSSYTLASFSEEGGIGLAKIAGYSEARLRTSALTLPLGQSEVTASVPQLRRTMTSTEFFNTAQGRLIRGDYQVGLSSQFSVRIGEEERKGELEGRIHVTVQAR